VTTVAVIGGIGCGKSSVTSRLASHGAAVVDADVIAREVVEPGTPTLAHLVETFGAGVLDDHGGLDRAALAAVAFADADATTRLNAIVHPAVGVELARQVADAREHAPVVVVAIPLFREEHRALLGIDLVVCVDCAPDVARTRLVEQRGMDRGDVDRRMAAQTPRAQRAAAADVVLDNDGIPAALDAEVDALWTRLAAP
jgi:dephospho-CoA kinase